MVTLPERISAVEERLTGTEERVAKIEKDNRGIWKMLNTVENNSLITRELVTSLKETNDKLLVKFEKHDEHLNQWIGRRDFVKIIFTAIGAIAATVGILAAFDII